MTVRSTTTVSTALGFRYVSPAKSGRSGGTSKSADQAPPLDPGEGHPGEIEDPDDEPDDRGQGADASASERQREDADEEEVEGHEEHAPREVLEPQSRVARGGDREREGAERQDDERPGGGPRPPRRVSPRHDRPADERDRDDAEAREAQAAAGRCRASCRRAGPRTGRGPRTPPMRGWRAATRAQPLRSVWSRSAP